MAEKDLKPIKKAPKKDKTTTRKEKWDNFLEQPGVLKKIKEISKKHGFSPERLMAVMEYETAGSLSPGQRSSVSSATGLIQFMEDTAKELGTSTDALAKMSTVDQLGYVEKYYDRFHKFGDDPYDVVMAASSGRKKDSDIIYGKGSKKALANPSWQDEDGNITKASARKAARNFEGYTLPGEEGMGHTKTAQVPSMPRDNTRVAPRINPIKFPGSEQPTSIQATDTQGNTRPEPQRVSAEAAPETPERPQATNYLSILDKYVKGQNQMGNGGPIKGEPKETPGEKANRLAHEKSSEQARLETIRDKHQKSFNQMSNVFGTVAAAGLPATGIPNKVAKGTPKALKEISKFLSRKSGTPYKIGEGTVKGLPSRTPGHLVDATTDVLENATIGSDLAGISSLLLGTYGMGNIMKETIVPGGGKFNKDKDTKNSTEKKESNKEIWKKELDSATEIFTDPKEAWKKLKDRFSNKKALGGGIGSNIDTSPAGGLTTFNTGGTHSQNPLGGIPQGFDEAGKMNSVEEGETKYKFKNDDVTYIFNNRKMLT